MKHKGIGVIVLAILLVMGWHGGTWAADRVRSEQKLVYYRNDLTVRVNGLEGSFEVEPFIIDPGWIMVPVEFLAQSLGAQVTWEDSSSALSVTLAVPSADRLEEVEAENRQLRSELAASNAEKRRAQQRITSLELDVARLDSELIALKNRFVPRQETLTYSNGQYSGYVLDGKEHGYGTLTWTDGGKYVGEWKEGKRTGQGTRTWPRGNKYEGEWKDNELHGQGTHSWGPGENGEKYVGEWREGKRTGQGTYVWPDGTRYVGEFKDGKKSGLGVQQNADGTIYAGAWTDNELTTVSSATKPVTTTLPESTGSTRTVQDIATQLKSKVFRLDIYDHSGTISSSGSAVAVGPHEVITNYHVIDDAVSAKLIDESGRSFDVMGMTASNQGQDLAVLRVAQTLQPVPLRTALAGVGEEVVAIGSPIGLTNTVSTGIVSAIRTIRGYEAIQITAPISSGSSGGGVFDRQGQLLGVTFGSFVDGQNLNLAIPMKYVQPLVALGKAGSVEKLPGSGSVSSANWLQTVRQRQSVLTLGSVSIYPTFDLVPMTKPKSGQAGAFLSVDLDRINYDRFLDGMLQGNLADRRSQLKSYLERTAEIMQTAYPGLEVNVILFVVAVYDFYPTHVDPSNIEREGDKWKVIEGQASVKGKSENWQFHWW